MRGSLWSPTVSARTHFPHGSAESGGLWTTSSSHGIKKTEITGCRPEWLEFAEVGTLQRAKQIGICSGFGLLNCGCTGQELVKQDKEQLWGDVTSQTQHSQTGRCSGWPVRSEREISTQVNLKHFSCACVRAQLCPTLCNPMDGILPGSSVHGISQARILEWVATSLLPGIFPTQGSNPHLLPSPVLLEDSLPLSSQGSPAKDIRISARNQTKETPYGVVTFVWNF